MITVDTITIIICSILAVLTILGVVANPFLRGVGQKDDAPDSESEAELPPVTILIPTHDNAEALERNLPSLLTQDYPDFRVVVVATKGDSATEDVLTHYAADAHLYSTFIPSTSRYMSRGKLQVTLGVKAAQTEWIVMTSASCHPLSDEWLRAIVAHMQEPYHIVQGYVSFADDAKPYYRFERLRTAHYLLRRAAKGTAWRANMPLVAFRKSDFMSRQGYLGNLQYVGGEYDFLVNKYATEGNSAIALDEVSRLEEEAPSARSWMNKRMFQCDTTHRLERRHSMHWLMAMDHLFPHLCLIACIAAMAWGITGEALSGWALTATQYWMPAATALLCLIILFISRMVIASKAISRLGEHIAATATLPLMEMSIIWHNLAARIAYWRADKSDFTSHKL